MSPQRVRDASRAVASRDFSEVFGVPPEVGTVVREFRSCEFSTIARDGTPVTWPTMPFFEPDDRRFVITSSIGLAQKAFNVRRNGRVAMLFSNPTGSGLVAPPLVLIQGDADAPEELASLDGFMDRAQLLFERQPIGFTMLGLTPGPVRALADWYLWRVLIYVRPRKIRWWPNGDLRGPFGEMVV